MLGKVRPTTHRANGSTPQPKAGLSEGRLALVHRYMIDAEEADARARAAAEAVEARAREAARLAAAVEEQTRREAAEILRKRSRMEWRRAEALLATRALSGPKSGASEDEKAPRRAPMIPGRVPAIVVEEIVDVNGRRVPWEDGPQTKEGMRAARRAAKDAARRLASLEKKEARERKALAKAAARRRG